MADRVDHLPARPLGCQARPWLQTWGRETFVAQLGTAMAEIADIGFIGFETALACLPVDDPAAFARLRDDANGIELSGAHAGGKWWDPEASDAVDELADLAGRLPALGCDRLVLSTHPMPSLSEERIDDLTSNLARLASVCHDRAGVRIAIHNHAAELADDARVLTAILDRCPPEQVGLGADLGWVAYAGVDVVAFIERFGARLDYLHVRDVTTEPVGFVEVGRGTLDHAKILRALDGVGYSGWLVAESELSDDWHGATEPGVTARAQFDGLRQHVDA